KREAISLVSTEYSKSPWTEARLRETASRYGVSTLILFRDGQYNLERASGSPFLTDLLHGNAPPWVVLAAQNSKVMIYQLIDDNSPGAPPPLGAAHAVSGPAPLTACAAPFWDLRPAHAPRAANGYHVGWHHFRPARSGRSRDPARPRMSTREVRHARPR